MSISFLGGLTFVLVLAAIILLHEIGHFAVARLLRIEVEEFGIGYPPRLLTLFTWKGTRFTLNWIPLGGFNRLKAEDDPNVAGGFASAKPLARIAVLFAGAFMNLLMAVFAFSLYFNDSGIPDTRTVVMIEVMAGSPAEAAGILPGDVVLTADGEAIHQTEQLRALTRARLDQPILLTVDRGGQTVELTITPDSQRPEDQGAMGVLLGNPVRPVRTWFETLPYSVEATYASIRQLLALPGRLIAGSLTPEEAQIGGPRSIWNLFQQAVARDIQSRQPEQEGASAAPTYYTLWVIISLTITVAVLNLLPLPAFDGGRIFFALVELIFRRRVPPRFEAVVHGVGFILVISLMGYFYIMDFIKPATIVLP